MRNTQIGQFLLNHYREALEVTTTTAKELEAIQSQLNISHHDFEGYLQQEKVYLQNLRREPPDETLQYVYVERLQELGKAT